MEENNLQLPRNTDEALYVCGTSLPYSLLVKRVLFDAHITEECSGRKLSQSSSIETTNRARVALGKF